MIVQSCWWTGFYLLMSHSSISHLPGANSLPCWQNSYKLTKLIWSPVTIYNTYIKIYYGLPTNSILFIQPVFWVRCAIHIISSLSDWWRLTCANFSVHKTFLLSVPRVAGVGAMLTGSQDDRSQQFSSPLPKPNLAKLIWFLLSALTSSREVTSWS